MTVKHKIMHEIILGLYIYRRLDFYVESKCNDVPSATVIIILNKQQ